MATFIRNFHLRMHHFVLILTIANYAVAAEMKVIYQWKYLDYAWNSEEDRQSAIAEGRYNYTQITTIDVQKALDGRVFVTTPATSTDGIPATLSTVSSREGPGGPLLQPYPNWSWHTQEDCSGITSVFRVAVDECDRLWVVDTGKRGVENQVCPAQILVFDLSTDELRQRIIIPNDISHNPINKTMGLLDTHVLETEGIDCRQTWVYIGDVQGGGLVVWDGSQFSRLNGQVFKADPTAESFTIAGVNFTSSDGIFGLALSPRNSLQARRLFFRPLASFREYSLAADDLHRLGSGVNSVTYITYNYQFPSQATSQVFSREGVMFVALTTEIAIACWNMNDPMDDEHVAIVAQDNETLQYATTAKISKRGYNVLEEDLWVSTCRYEKIATGTMDYSEVNFRILSAPVEDLVRDSICQPPRF